MSRLGAGGSSAPSLRPCGLPTLRPRARAALGAWPWWRLRSAPRSASGLPPSRRSSCSPDVEGRRGADRSAPWSPTEATGERWQLPAERLLSGLGFEVSEGAQEGWSLAAYDEAAVDASGRSSSPRSPNLLGSVDEAPLELGIWLDLAAAPGSPGWVGGHLGRSLPLASDRADPPVDDGGHDPSPLSTTRDL